MEHMAKPKQSRRSGFTLIELLIVVVIIGILAAIAIPKFANTKEKAYLATMKADLRNLATAEEAYASDNAGSYFSAGPCTSATTPSRPPPIAITSGWPVSPTTRSRASTCAEDQRSSRRTTPVSSAAVASVARLAFCGTWSSPKISNSWVSVPLTVSTESTSCSAIARLVAGAA